MKSDFLPFAKPSINQACIDEVLDCLATGWLTTGPKVKAFEAQCQRALNAPFVVALSSGTAALHLSLLALQLKPGDEIITTPLTFAATANTIALANAKPVFVDVEPDSMALDPNKVEAAITPHTRAILPVHFAGLPADLDPLYTLAEQHELRVIEDAAHAIGAHYKGRIIGSFGDTQIFSFHPNKNLTTGEGGLIATHDEELARMASLARFHGIDREAWNRDRKDGSVHYDVVQPGFKYNMMDLQAAIGLHQLPQLEEFIERRTSLAKSYHDVLVEFPQLTLPRKPLYRHRHAWALYTPLINPEASGMERDQLIQRFKENNIGIGLHFPAVHLFSYYRNKYGYKAGDFPIAENIASRIFSLPLFPDLTLPEQDRVIETMIKIFRSPA